MKRCDYCGRDNEDEAVFCRECGTDRFVGDPPPVRTPIRMVDIVNDFAASLDELASSWEILLSWMMAAWIVRVALGAVSMNYGVARSYPVWSISVWSAQVGFLLIRLTFALAPLIGGFCIVRWLRKEKGHSATKLMAWMLLLFFVGVFCIVWVIFWNSPGEWILGF